MATIQRGYRFRCYPSDEQKIQLAQTFGCVRVVYNHFLQIRRDAWFDRQERIYYNDTAKQMTLLKREAGFAWLNDVSNVCLQQSLRGLDRGFTNFFQGRAGYPTAKKKAAEQTAKYQPNAFTYKNGQLKLAKHDAPLNVRWHRSLPKKAVVSSVTVTMDRAGRYFVSLQTSEPLKASKVIAKTVGVDLGITSVVVCSDGTTAENQRFLKRSEKKLAHRQRRLSRKKKGSNNRRKARLRVARLHAQIADQRRDFAHKLSSRLVNENQVISAETLAIKNMVKNRRLSKAISDVAWGQLLGQIEYKAEWAGRSFVKIDRWYPSTKRCSTPRCGHVMDKLPLKIRQWVCPACHTHHDRDRNAAINIDRAGRAILAGASQLRTH